MPSSSRADSPSWPWATPRAGAPSPSRRVTELKQTITVSNEGGSTASGTLDGMIQANADVVPGDSGSPLLGMSTCSVCTLRLRARSPVASGSARARLAKPSMPPACPTPVTQRRLADAASPAAPASCSARHGPPPACTPARAVPDWMAGLWRSCEFGSFVLGTTDDRPRERPRRPGSPQLRLPASRNSANQPGPHALSARAAMTPCPAGAQVRRRAIPPRRDCSHRSVADRRNTSGRTSSPQRCMSPGPNGTPVSFGA